MNLAGLDLKSEQARIRQLPVIRELTIIHGPPAGGLDGQPLRVDVGVTRMVWAWPVEGRNFHLCVDHAGGRGSWQWRVRAAGAAGHIDFTLGAAERPTHVNLRAVAVAAGLLEEPDETA